MLRVPAIKRWLVRKWISIDLTGDVESALGASYMLGAVDKEAHPEDGLYRRHSFYSCYRCLKTMRVVWIRAKAKQHISMFQVGGSGRSGLVRDGAGT